MSSNSEGFDEWKISEFLKNLKVAVESGRLFVIKREKNNEFLARCGMTPEEREKVITGLTRNEYKSGPEIDRDYTNEKDIWKFNTEYLGKKIHIKVKLILEDNQYYVKCLSFHD